MADVTFGVKVTPELKERIEQFIKDSDFDTNKEWFQHLLSIYDLHQLKHQDSTKRYAGDLNHIELSLTRIQETIVEMMKRTADEVSHQEDEWIKASDALQHQLKQSTQKCNDLESKLSETEDLVNQQKKNLAELQKQTSILDELCITLKKSLLDKEVDIETLKTERENREMLDYPATIHRLTEENHTLKQQLQTQQHQTDLTRMEYEKRLEVEQMRTDFAKKEVELLLQSRRIPQKEEPDVSARKRGRPRKDEVIATVSGQQLVADYFEDDESEEQEPYMPDSDEILLYILGDEPPHSNKE